MPRSFGRISRQFVADQARDREVARRAQALRDFDRFLKTQRLRFSGKLAGSERRIQTARRSIEIPESWSGDSWELLQVRGSRSGKSGG